MSPFWSIVKRETGERRLLMVGALVLGLLPYAAVLLPGEIGQTMARERLQIAAILAAVASAVTALFLGGSVIARDLAERRLSFYFARPIPNWAIWGGKMAAAAALSLATGALILLPALLTGTPELAAPPLYAWLGLAIALAFPTLLGLAHAVSVSIRTRSPWLLLDLAGLLGVTAIVLAARDPLVKAGIPGLHASRGSILLGSDFALAALFAVATLVAGARQVSVGRTDPRRGHKALSLTFWSLALAVALLFSGFSRWVLDVEVKDLREIRIVVAARQGNWVLASGPAQQRPGFQPNFLFDTASGRSLRIDAKLPFQFWSPFSSDGRRALWLKPEGRFLYRLEWLDLTRSDSRPVSTSLSFAGAPQDIALSPDGSRIAFIENGGHRLLVHELPQGRLLAAEALRRSVYFGQELRFPATDRVQVFQMSFSTGECTVVELDLATRRSQEVACPGSHWNGPGRGIPIPYVALQPWQSHALAGGRTVRFSPGKAGGSLILGGSGPGQTRRLHFPQAESFVLGGQPAPDELVVLVRGPVIGMPMIPRDFTTYLVDLTDGEARPLGKALAPVLEAESAPAGSPATRLLYNERNLVRIDPTTGQRTVVLRVS